MLLRAKFLLLIVAKEIVFIKDSKTTNNDIEKKCSTFLNERMCLAYNYLLHIFRIHIDLRMKYAWICFAEWNVCHEQKRTSRKIQCGRSNESLIDPKIYSIYLIRFEGNFFLRWVFFFNDEPEDQRRKTTKRKKTP